MLRLLIAGFSHAAGIGKESNKPYDMCNLHNLTPIRGFKNERGEGHGFGFETNDRSRLPVKRSPELVAKLEAVQYPAVLELSVEPHPEDPLRNIVVDAKMIRSLAMADK
ncbi:hypothetical protein O1O06_16290 [Grimontia hollisae]|uniref:hypothetical protein n=1 Tax=Grimontia hollisae TaxID=673 RepID=UPI00130327E0|nr:hypothetical protein [Grimontia hollisae]MDF2186301.1 hypothetical protein [Grimontia hollisae]